MRGDAAPTPRLRRRPDVPWRQLLDGVLVLGDGPHGEPEPLAVTGPGAELWALLDQPRHRNELAVELAATFGADVDRVAADLDPILDRLVAAGVLEPEAAP